MKKNIILGVTGSIACYKAADLTSQLTQSGINVQVVMTRHATEFVAPLTFQTLSRNPVTRNPGTPVTSHWPIPPTSS